jgi:hypothetical protein
MPYPKLVCVAKKEYAIPSLCMSRSQAWQRSANCAPNKAKEYAVGGFATRYAAVFFALGRHSRQPKDPDVRSFDSAAAKIAFFCVNGPAASVR